MKKLKTRKVTIELIFGSDWQEELFVGMLGLTLEALKSSMESKHKLNVMRVTSEEEIA
jgi:hypothetical protein